MNLGAEIRTVAETAVPELRTARWIAYGVGALVVVALIAGGFWWAFLRPIEDRTKAEQAKVDATTGTAAAAIAAATIPQLQEATRQKVDVDVHVQRGTIDVRQAPDAGTAVAGVSAAVIRGNCMLPTLYHADSACQSLPADPDGLGPARSDAGSDAQSD